MKLTQEETRRLNERLQEVDKMSYIVAHGYAEIALDGLFTLESLRKIVGILESELVGRSRQHGHTMPPPRKV